MRASSASWPSRRVASASAASAAAGLAGQSSCAFSSTSWLASTSQSPRRSERHPAGAGLERGEELVGEGDDRQRREVDPVAANHLQQEVERPVEAVDAQPRRGRGLARGGPPACPAGSAQLVSASAIAGSAASGRSAKLRPGQARRSTTSAGQGDQSADQNSTAS